MSVELTQTDALKLTCWAFSAGVFLACAVLMLIKIVRQLRANFRKRDHLEYTRTLRPSIFVSK